MLNDTYTPWIPIDQNYTPIESFNLWTVIGPDTFEYPKPIINISSMKPETIYFYLTKENAPVGTRCLVKDSLNLSIYEISILEWSKSGYLKIRYNFDNKEVWLDKNKIPLLVEVLEPILLYCSKRD